MKGTLQEPRSQGAQLPSGGGLSVAMVSNPRSGGNKKGMGAIRSFLAEHPGIDHAEAVTPAELEAALAGFAERKADLLVVNGGDGTVQAALTSLYGRSVFAHPPLLALLESGTTSMLARDVGAAGAPTAALAKILAWCGDPGRDPGLVHERPVLKVSQDGEKEPSCGMFFGAGAIPVGIELCHGKVNPNGIRGELIPGLILARLLLAVLTGNHKALPATEIGIELDRSGGWRNSCLFAMVTTLERLFLGLRPFWGDEEGALRFTAVRSGAPHLLRNLPSLLRGRRTAKGSPENGFFSHNAREITLDFRGKFTLDGELFEARSPLKIEPAGPARFLRI